ncbi:MAG: hypothetical protein RJA87_71 [Pseudomonadota bacterium]|jgi:hypothetical protein
MSLDPERALQQALLTQLKANADLALLLGNPLRVYDEPPADIVYPYVSLGRSETRPWGGLDGEGLEHVLSLTVVSVFGGSEEAKAVMALVRLSLHGAALSLDGHRLINLRVTYADLFKAADWRSTYGVLRLRAVTEPLDPTS